MITSIAGTVGGALSLLLVWTALPADTLGRAALYGGTVAGFVFAAIVQSGRSCRGCARAANPWRNC
ncbi:MAG: hypothetical protein U5K56_05980 [Halioglobus sp.]|nr:hypothetical protein [Halioglobus sp.]